MKVLNEYPRPQMRRDSYINLNGNWHCFIYDGHNNLKYTGPITVPYSPETKTSGVMKNVRPTDTLVYDKSITIDPSFNKGRILLNFGAVDQICELYINGKRVGKHIGGYIPFSFDITDYITDNNINIKLLVKDYTEKSELSRGKQSSNPGGITYQAQSGIWQTVWMESVPKKYIKKIRIRPDVEYQGFRIKVYSDVDDICDVEVDNKTYHIETNKTYRIKLNNPIYWSVDNPHLYDVDVTLGKDKVHTYFGYRDIAIKNVSGIPYLYLNNKPIFIRGVLEQGYYADGLYTPDSYETIYNDIKNIKDLGFNTIRKHIKIEPALYYYYCDKLGVLVLQDMVNGGGKYNNIIVGLPMFINCNLKDDSYFLFRRSNKTARKIYEYEIRKTIDALDNFPSIIMWTIFNEGWGQYDAKRLYGMVKKMDSSRLIDPTSGWYDQGLGEVRSHHNYFKKFKYQKDKLNRATLISEFGGFSFGKSKTPYKKFKSEKEFLKQLKELIQRDVKPYINQGLVGYVYTQYNDVENEQNGLVDKHRVLKSRKLKNFFKDKHMTK